VSDVAAQGGNKSMLSYRNDIGVPGYTGFNPSGSCIPMKPKGNTVRTGKKITAQSVRIRKMRIAAMHLTFQWAHNFFSSQCVLCADSGKIPDKESLSRAVAETNNLHTHSM
jgi:hypothetical protein